MSEAALEIIYNDRGNGIGIKQIAVDTNVEKTLRMIEKSSGMTPSIRDIFAYIAEGYCYTNMTGTQMAVTIGIRDTDGKPLALLFEVTRPMERTFLLKGNRCLTFERCLEMMGLSSQEKKKSLDAYSEADSISLEEFLERETYSPTLFYDIKSGDIKSICIYYPLLYTIDNLVTYEQYKEALSENRLDSLTAMPKEEIIEIIKENDEDRYIRNGIKQNNLHYDFRYVSITYRDEEAVTIHTSFKINNMHSLVNRLNEKTGKSYDDASYISYLYETVFPDRARLQSWSSYENPLDVKTFIALYMPDSENGEEIYMEFSFKSDDAYRNADYDFKRLLDYSELPEKIKRNYKIIEMFES